MELCLDASHFGGKDLELDLLYSPDIDRGGFCTPMRNRELMWRQGLAGEPLSPEEKALFARTVDAATSVRLVCVYPREIGLVEQGADSREKGERERVELLIFNLSRARQNSKCPGARASRYAVWRFASQGFREGDGDNYQGEPRTSVRVNPVLPYNRKLKPWRRCMGGLHPEDWINWPAGCAEAGPRARPWRTAEVAAEPGAGAHAPVAAAPVPPWRRQSAAEAPEAPERRGQLKPPLKNDSRSKRRRSMSSAMGSPGLENKSRPTIKLSRSNSKAIAQNFEKTLQTAVDYHCEAKEAISGGDTARPCRRRTRREARKARSPKSRAGSSRGASHHMSPVQTVRLNIDLAAKAAEKASETVDGCTWT